MRSLPLAVFWNQHVNKEHPREIGSNVGISGPANHGICPFRYIKC